MKLKQFVTDERAVSAVIGSIMLVAVMLLIVTGVLTVFLMDSDQFQGDIAHANFEFDWQENGAGYDLTITHAGGQTYTGNNTARREPCWTNSLQIRSEEARVDGDPSKYPDGVIDCWAVDGGDDDRIEGGDQFKVGYENDRSAHPDSEEWAASRSVYANDLVEVVWVGPDGSSAVLASFRT